ncbi:MAG: hypothetical protein BV456_03550 [Thermoplasmata archaeon M8B2D]|nr:MAG: hypothetical protein BV456_03550 [Thermoplasmata archaeon M8B2D]
MIKNELTKKIERIKFMSEMLIENSSTYTIAKGNDNWSVIAGLSFPKNSNISKSALKRQITTLRNELLLLENLF